MRQEKNTSKVEQHYGLLTAVTMIIGIVIGSGIFFKCDDVLNYVGGNIGLGVLAFCIGSFGIIFGSLTLTELSIRTKENGGVVGYFDEFISRRVASGFGWFQTFAYMPAITVVIAWVAGIYTCNLFGIHNVLENQILVGTIYMVGFFALNVISIKLGGYFQNLTAIIKLIPLLGIALVGLFWGQPAPEISAGIEVVTTSNVGFGFLAALAPIAFSNDGWIIALSITNEVKNPKRNMTLALIIGPIIVLTVYVLYFVGFSKILGPEYIMTMGDSAVDKVGELILGANGTKIILIFMIVAILGVLNGVILGGLRMPHILATKEMIPGSGKISVINPKYQLSLSSCFVYFVVSVAWMVVHYITQKTGVMKNGDVSEIAIVFSYLCYILLYVKVILLAKKGEITSKFKGIICPVFGILGAAIIFIGGFTSNPVYAAVFALLSLSFVLAGMGYYSRRHM